MKVLREEIQKIKKAAIKKVEEAVEETYKENKRLQGIFLLLLMDYFEQYSKEGRFWVNRYQRQAILKQLERKIIEETKVLGYQDVEYVKKVLEEIIKEAYEKHRNLMGGDANILLSPLWIQEIICRDYKDDNFENRVLNNKRKLAGRLFVAFDKALLNNATLEETSEKLQEVFKKTDYESYRLLMNEQGRVFDAVQTKVFIEEATIEKVVWESVLCSNTCAYCEMMDGSVFEVNDPNRPEIPAHVLCQCYWTPME